MDSPLEEAEATCLSEIRVILIGSRWSGKSSAGNTILGKERLECGRTRTVQPELRHEDIHGRHLMVVDCPGWNNFLSPTEIPEVDKQMFKLNMSKCPPGPHAVLLVIPIDTAFTKDQRKPLEVHMLLLGEKVWRNTMVLFTCGDFLGGKSIEQHIESEGEALKWLVEKCGNRYHVLNNKDKSNSSQVTQLLKKIDKMVWDNGGNCFEIDQHTLLEIKDKQTKAFKRAQERKKNAEEHRQWLQSLMPEGSHGPSEIRLVLLGSRHVGKSSLGSTILGIPEKEGQPTVQSVVLQGCVDGTTITLIDTPGWWKGYSVSETPELIKQEVISSMFLCPPGPHMFLLVIDADASFNENHRKAVKGHLKLLGRDVWNHTMAVFTRGDKLKAKIIEEHIEGEGEALRSLVDKCSNMYHVIDNKNTDDGTQVTEMLQKIKEFITANNGKHFVPDEKIFRDTEEKRMKVEEGVNLRQTKVKVKRECIKRSISHLEEIRIVIIGQKTGGKSATANTIIGKELFAACENIRCEVGTAEVAGRLVTVIDTPGWEKMFTAWTKERDSEIVRGVSLCPSGVHAVLLVLPLDIAYTETQQAALEEHVRLLGDNIWRHLLVLFTYGDRLAGIAIEEHIEREKYSLQWLVEKCENRYHVIDNTKKTDASQVTELLEKIEEMVAGNSGRLFNPNMNDIHRRIEEKLRQKKINEAMMNCLEGEFRRRELELMTQLKQTLCDLRPEASESKKTTKTRFPLQKKKAEEKLEMIQHKISQGIAKLDQDILRSKKYLRSSRDFLPPSMHGDSPPLSAAGSTWSLPDRHYKVIKWFSTLMSDRAEDNQLSLNLSEASSGYRSIPTESYALAQGQVFTQEY